MLPEGLRELLAVAGRVAAHEREEHERESREAEWSPRRGASPCRSTEPRHRGRQRRLRLARWPGRDRSASLHASGGRSAGAARTEAARSSRFANDLARLPQFWHARRLFDCCPEWLTVRQFA